MLYRVKDFLARYWDGQSPLLLGYSGGPDSKALLYALLEAGCKTLHLAHVDHAWRKESGEEAIALKREAELLEIPFHLTRLPAKFGEAESRVKRLLFFRSLFGNIPFQALLLAHHAGDIAETVLKRVLEGAHLPFLGGMEPCAEIETIPVWRPLLSTKRREIEDFLSKRNLQALIDPTNFDPSYQRARIRSEILPALAYWFGKEISENLFLLSQRASELKAYLKEKTLGNSTGIGPWGLFGLLGDVPRVEARYLLQEWGDRAEIVLPRTILEPLLNALALKLPNRKFAPRILADRGIVFFLSKIPPCFGKDPLLLKPGSWTWGDWAVDIEENRDPIPEMGWKGVWSGQFFASAPEGLLKLPPKGTGLRHLWNEKKVPAFFRYLIPIVWREGRLSKEFLTGKILPEIQPSFKLSFSNHSGTTS